MGADDDEEAKKKVKVGTYLLQISIRILILLESMLKRFADDDVQLKSRHVHKTDPNSLLQIEGTRCYSLCCTYLFTTRGVRSGGNSQF